MDKIEIGLLNPHSIVEAEDLMVTCARLTQRGDKIRSLKDFMDLHNSPYSLNTVASLTSLPHTTLQKFGLITMVIVGASRRFLAQITRHQNEVKFMSTSLQYSDMTGQASFVIPYEIMTGDAERCDDYCRYCNQAIKNYNRLIADGVDNDTAGYLMPQAMRTTLVISATPYQWKHMIQQRVCRRNTTEMRYVMLRCWEALYAVSIPLFEDCGPTCMTDECREGKMSCREPISTILTPSDILQRDFPLLYEHYDIRPLS